tara:strand:- start:902 stop:2335 length:1434 start_codon:yes stop_codon:yes gene_type:complete
MKDKNKFISNIKLDEIKKNLEDVASLFVVLNLRFFLIDRVLLSTINEEAFYNWNGDVKLAVYEEEVMPISSKLLNIFFDNGFKIICVNPFSSFFKINVKKRGQEFSFIGFKKSNYKWRYNSNFRYPSSLFDNAKYINYLGSNYLAPQPVEEMTAYIYDQREYLLSTSIQSNYINKAQVPKFLFFLIIIRHFVKHLNSYFSRFMIGLNNKIFPKKREYLFNNIMLNQALTEDCSFVEVGSSDGQEMSNAIKFTNGRLNGYLIEPSIENLNLSQININKQARKYNIDINFNNFAISDNCGNMDYYFSASNPNLSGLKSPKKNATKRVVKTITINEFLLLNNIPFNSHLVIKMDVEGHEIEILKSSLEVFDQMPRVSILLELHQSLYKGPEMKEILDSLFLLGFKTSIVETAFVKVPYIFEEAAYKPVISYNNRSLFYDLDNNFTSICSSKEIINVAYIKPYFTKRIIRSILIQKNDLKP